MVRLWDPWADAQALAGKTVLLGMSGGVDSSAAAVALQQRGATVLGVTMKNFCYSDVEDNTNTSCCSLSHMMDARRVCEQLGIEHYMLDVTSAFEPRVMDRFIQEYESGRTPNPCVDCNRTVRFPILIEKADELGADYVATGHYARTLRDAQGNTFLSRGRDAAKDQTYFLHGIPHDCLQRTVFPLGTFVKAEVRDLAQAAELSVARKPESQEICFLPNGGRHEFLQARGGAQRPGEIRDESGAKLGEHRGIGNFTVGQRRGLNLAMGQPMYVKSIDAASATVVVCPDSGLKTRGVVVDSFWRRGDFEAIDIEAQLRYRSRPVSLRALESRGEVVEVRFAHPQKAVAPGQAAVFYAGDLVVGGGRILETLH